jgi:hypothetical protein
MVFAAVAQGLVADGLLFLDSRGFGAAGREKVVVVGVLQVRRVLVGPRDPAVADEEAFEVPGYVDCVDEFVEIFVGGLLFVAFEDGAREVGDVLACVGFAGDVDLLLY